MSRPMTIANVAYKFGFSSPTIIKILNEYNVNRYKKAQIFNPECDERYFSEINTENKAYFLGFIITDGNIFAGTNGRQASISITQSVGDQYILQKFKEDIHVNTSISHDGRGCAMIAVRSDLMAKDLEQYGVKPNKTLTAYLPKLEQEDLMRHLVRGILDGDGNIKAHQTHRRNRYAHAISFCGSFYLMNDLADTISKTLNISRPHVYSYTDRNLSEVKWQSKDEMQEICKWLYDDATIYLTRKYQKYIDFQTHYNL